MILLKVFFVAFCSSKLLRFCQRLLNNFLRVFRVPMAMFKGFLKVFSHFL